MFRIRNFDRRFNLGEEDSGYWPIFLEIFWPECFCGVVAFSLLLFSLFKCLPPESPLWIWKAQRRQESRLRSCGTEFKGEMGTFRPPSLFILAQERRQWFGVEALSSDGEYAFIWNISCAIILGHQGEAEGMDEPNADLFIWKHMKINSLPE